MAFDADYLSRSLERRLAAAKQSFPNSIEKMYAMQASKGMLGSGSTFIQMKEITLKGLTENFNSAATFAYTLAGNHDSAVAIHLNNFADVIETQMVDYIRERGTNTGLQAQHVSKLLEPIIKAVHERKTQLTDDFAHGIMGDEKLKKDPIVNVVANQTNSPGAVQQVGIGDFSQSAMVQNQRQLSEAIDSAIASPEFAALSPDNQIAFKDIADALKDEAMKPQPDPGKMKRWGNRLLDFSKDIGMKVAVSTIAQVLSRIFVG